MSTPRLAALALLLAACVHRAPDTRNLFVSGKAHACVDRLPGKPAAGQAVRLVVGRAVVAEDVVGPDGSFVLHPKYDYDVSVPAVVEAGVVRVSLSNDFASWMQEHLHYQLLLCIPPEGTDPASAPHTLSTQSPGGDTPTPPMSPPPKGLIPRVPF